MSDSLRELHRLLVESLERDEAMVKELRALDKSSRSRTTNVNGYVNKNRSLGEMMATLKTCMLNSIDAIECVTEIENRDEEEPTSDVNSNDDS